jgi:hypothetical protein
MSRRPVDLSVKNSRDFLSKLGDEERLKVIGAQKRYVRLMARVAPTVE